MVGASRGIGMEVARELWAEGCTVISVARSLDNATNGRKISLQRDLMAPGAPAALAGTVKTTIGHPDIIVHVLGGSQGITGTWAPSYDWEKVMRLNLGIAHDLNAAFVPKMQTNRWGRIIHLSSIAPRTGTGYAPYTTAKAALDGYIKIVSKEVSRDGVIISAVAPGVIHTPGRYFASLSDKEREDYFDKYIPIHRFGRAEEVAKAVAFMASDHAAYMAGSILYMDGGAR